MAKLFEMKMTAGKDFLPADSTIAVEITDKSFSEIPVSEASKFAGKSRILYKTSHFDIPFSDLEMILMGVKEGPVADYRRSKERLHVLDSQGTYVPKLADTLRIAQQQSGLDEKTFVNEVHSAMQAYAGIHGFETVALRTVNTWFNGDVVLPDNHEDVAALASLADRFRVFELFGDIYRDIKTFIPSLKDNQVMTNYFGAYTYYNTVRSFLGKNARPAFSKNGCNGKKNGVPQQRKVNLHDTEQYIRNLFCEVLTPELSAVSLISVREIDTKKDEAFARNKAAYKKIPGVATISKTEPLSGISMKQTEEVVRDITIIERTLLNQVYSFAFDVGESGYFDSKFENKKIGHDYILYIADHVQERVRKCTIEKAGLYIPERHHKACIEAGNELYKLLFESQDANTRLNLPNDSFQRLKRAHEILVPLFPKIIETYIMAHSNYEKLKPVVDEVDAVIDSAFNALSPDIQKRLTIGKVPRTSLIPQEENEKTADYKKRIDRYLRQSEKLGHYAEIADKALGGAIDMHDKFGVKYILTEHIQDYVRKLRSYVLYDDERYREVIQSFKIAPQLFCSLTDLESTLTRYNVDEFIPLDFDIKLMKELKSS